MHLLNTKHCTRCGVSSGGQKGWTLLLTGAAPLGGSQVGLRGLVRGLWKPEPALQRAQRRAKLGRKTRALGPGAWGLEETHWWVNEIDILGLQDSLILLRANTCASGQSVEGRGLRN